MAKFSVSNPGVKEYAIVGVGALGVFFVYRWWKNRTTAASPSTSSGSGSGSPSTATGLNTGAFSAFLQDWQSSTASGGAQVTVPNVEGQRRTAAGPVVRKSGLVPSFSAGSGTVTGESPKAGSLVPKGSTVDLTLRGK